MSKKYYRKTLAEKALSHTLYMEKHYMMQINESIQDSLIFYDLSWPEWFPENGTESPWKPNFIEDTTSGAINSIHRAYPNDTICALNFASFKNPGGGFLNGMDSQEESLCHASGLYNILRSFSSSYYAENRELLNGSLYKNRSIYSPDVPFPQISVEGDFPSYPVDILTCAAPNKAAAIKYKRANTEECQCALIDRILYLFKVLLRVDPTFSRIKFLVLGAFGCGVFGNNIVETATIFSHTICALSSILRQKEINLPQIYFAIPRLKANDRTMDTFINALLSAQNFYPVDTRVPLSNVKHFREQFLKG